MFYYKNKKPYTNQQYNQAPHNIEGTIYEYNDSDYMEPAPRYIPPNVIEDYIGETINTFIPGYGRRNVYVRGIDRNGMVSLVILKNKPSDCVKVHYSDLTGISKPKFKCY